MNKHDNIILTINITSVTENVFQKKGKQLNQLKSFLNTNQQNIITDITRNEFN